MFTLLLLVTCLLAPVLCQEVTVTGTPQQCGRYHEMKTYLNGIGQRIQEQLNIAEVEDIGVDESEIELTEETHEEDIVPDIPEPTIVSNREGVISSQSSDGWGGAPERAIDGNHNSNYGGHSCTHTQNSGTSWWKIDLTEESEVGFVRIYNRGAYGERLESAVIRVGNSENADDNEQCGDAISTVDIGNGPRIDTYCGEMMRGRYVSIHVDNYLTLCEVEVFSAELLSQGRIATQSSDGWSGIAGRAVDGSIAANYNRHSCTHTQLEPEAWWKVDLGNVYTVNSVRIYNREDCCHDRLNAAVIRVGDDAEGMLTNAQCGEPVTTEESTAASVDRDCGPLDGRYVSVSVSNNYLTLCEVEVWGTGDMQRADDDVDTPSGLLSLGKQTAQSSLGWGGLSMRAVDGDHHPRYGDRTCTHTQSDNPSWWRVDLGQSLTVRYVRIKNRADCCSDRLFNAQVRVGDSEDVVTNAECGVTFTMDDISGIPSPDRICNGDVGLQGRYVSVNVNNYLTLCEVEVYDMVPIGINGVATQSSIGWGGEASRGIDGNRATLWGQGTCTHTQNENAWWKVDLQETYDINYIRVFNREDCCTDRLVGAVIRVGLQEDPQSGEQCGETFTLLDITRSLKISRRCTLNGRYVSVTVTNYLTLCEVEIFGTPDAATIAAREAAAAEAARVLAEAERAAEEARQRAEAEAIAEAARVLEETRGIRLIGGSSESEGRVEIFAQNAWGTVCDDYWDVLDASVACRQMGYAGGALEAPGSARFGEGTVEIFLDDVACRNTEGRLLNCPNAGLGSHNCAHSEDASVICNTGEPEPVPSIIIRLQGGVTGNEGRVEVFLNGFWGTVCDDDWDIDDANVICRQLGFEHGAQDALQQAQFGAAGGLVPIELDDVSCSGTETDFLACPNLGIGRHNCAHTEDASVICNTMAPAPDVLIRLVGGGIESEGRVEVWHEGRWGTVCDDYWNMEDSNVVCRQLGFTSGARDGPMRARFGPGSGDILMDDVRCAGSETSVLDCPSISNHNCGHYEDASVICYSNAGSNGELRLIGGTNDMEGRVEIFSGSSWGTVCDDNWELNDGHTVCQQLGFGRAREAPQQARFGAGAGDIILDDVACSGTESSLLSCGNRGIRSHNCAHSEDASVICIGFVPTQLRLIGGGHNEGRVEVNIGGTGWGTICDDYWGMEDARVVCRQLGLPAATAATSRASFGQGSGDIILDDVQCSGSESDITDCGNLGLRRHNCAHSEDAGAQCGRPPPPPPPPPRRCWGWVCW